MSSLGMKFVSAVVAEKSVPAFLEFGALDHLFIGMEKDAFDYVRNFVKQYHAIPTEETIAAHTHVELLPVTEPASYYLDLVKARFVESNLKKAMQSATNLLAKDTPSPAKVEDALAVLASSVIELIAAKNSQKVIDFRHAYDLVWNTYRAKFTSPDNCGLQFGWPYIDKMTGGLGRGDLVSLVGRPGQGKALAHGTPVLLADGSFKPIEDMQVGDDLASIDGAPSKVFGVFPQGTRDLYRVTFGDGRHLDVDKSHLWQVGCKYWDGPRIMTTEEIIRWRSKAKRYRGTLWVPLASGDWGGAVTPSLDPYIIGALIGDGGLTSTTPYLTSVDKEIVDRVTAGLPFAHCLTPVQSPNRAQSYALSSAHFGGYSLDGMQAAPNCVTEALKAMGLMGCKSEHKHLPADWHKWRYADRLALLQGLMDTDGTVTPDRRQVSFGSSSERLADDVARLVRSLGGKALRQAPKKTTHLQHHRMTLVLPNPADAFSLPRKKVLCTPYTTHDPNHLKIVSVEPIGSGPATCIAVTHESRLFVAGDYVVTHNTLFMLYAAMHGWKLSGQTSAEQSRLFVSMEMEPLPIMQRLTGLYLGQAANKIKHADLSTAGIKKLKQGLTEVQGYAAPFYVVDGNLAATVEDIWTLARQLNPGAIFIDGAYLLQHPTERDRFRRVAENADLIKKDLASIAPTVTSWQFARSASKKSKTKAAGKPDIDDIGYSDAIGQVSSVVLGLFQEETIETVLRKKIEVLKGRSGEIGSFEVNWRWDKMDFSEYQETEVADLAFL